ncbi:MAG: hypothetical protein IJO32_07510 [Bacilli bacterium]|nr:hypothetical protein [Bacilli bacterium]
MERNTKKILNVLFIFFLFNIINNKNVVYGAEDCSLTTITGEYANCVISTSTSRNVTVPDTIKKNVVPKCINPSSAGNIDNGIPICLKEEYPVHDNFSYSSKNVAGGKTIFTAYFSGRVDAWSENNPAPGNAVSFNQIEQLNNTVVYPGMSLRYRRYETLASFVGEEMVETIVYSHENGLLKLSGEAIYQLPNTGDLFQSVSVSPNNFSVENIKLENVNGTWYISWIYDIKKLAVGWNSYDGSSNIFGAPGRWKKNNSLSKQISFHYFLPLKIEIEYLSNMCALGNDVSKKYAENNPGTCCYEYPETCCGTGIPGVQTPYEFAMARPGVCCKDIPESCCNVTTQSNGEPWIGSSNNDGIWVTYYKDKWQGNICCSDPTFVSKNPGKCSGLILSNPTSPETCSTAKTDYFYTTFYTSYDSEGHHLAKENVTCDINGNGACSSSYTFTYTIRIDKKKDYELNQVGHSYFDNTTTNDYDAYLKQKAKGNVMVGGDDVIEVPSTYKSNSLTKKNFSYKVSNPRIDPSDNSKYLIDITVTVYNLSKDSTSAPSAYDYNDAKIFFVPIKIALCWNDSGGSKKPSGNNTCTNMSYADKHLDKCCNESGSDFGKNNYLKCCNGSTTFYNSNKSICDTGPGDPKNKGYKADTSLTCNTATKTSNKEYSTTKKMDGTTYVNIDKENISIKASSTSVTSGTGFEYPLDITDNVEYSLNMANGYDKDHPLESKDVINTMYDGFKNELTNIKNNFSSYISSQEITFVDDRTDETHPIILDYDSLNISNLEYSGSTEYYYKDSSITCTEICNNRVKKGSYPHFYWVCEEYLYEWSNTGVTPENVCNSTNVGDVAILKATIYDTTAKQTYTYKTKLPYAFINKNNGNDIKYKNTNTSPGKNYISAGNKIYTNITDTTGTYNFDISIKNGGISKEIGSSSGENIYSCHYTVLNCAIEGTCPCNPETDPSCPENCDPVSDPSCPLPPPTPGTPNYYFRPISLTDPFPNDDVSTDSNYRETAPNWFKYKNGNSYTYITQNTDNSRKGESIYTQEPMYEITITNQMADDIREFNDKHPDYSSYDTMAISNDGSCGDGLCRYSKFLNSLTGTVAESDKLSDFNETYDNKLKVNITNRQCRIGDFGVLGGGC